MYDGASGVGCDCLQSAYPRLVVMASEEWPSDLAISGFTRLRGYRERERGDVGGTVGVF